MRQQCPQLAKADFASSSRHVRERQRIAALDAQVDAPERQAVALGAEPTADVPPWVLLGVKIDQCPHSAEADTRARNEGSGFDPSREHSLDLPIGLSHRPRNGSVVSSPIT
jgi:hypothetical protein